MFHDYFISVTIFPLIEILIFSLKINIKLFYFEKINMSDAEMSQLIPSDTLISIFMVCLKLY